MKKRLLAGFLALCMALTLLPVPALAADSDFTIRNGVLTKYNGSGGDVTIPDGVTSIGANAFCYCTSLTSVSIPGSVTSIGNYAFSGCTSLTSITIPGSVTFIGRDAFSGTPWLENQGEFAIVNGILIAYQGSGGSVSIPSSVTSIGDSAFSCCTSLTSITIPDSVTSIEFWAFSGCTSLTSVTIPDSVTSIGVWAFAGCDSLTSVTALGSVTSIGRWTFLGTPWLENQGEFAIVNGVLIAYQGSGGSVSIPSSVTSIGNSAFFGCASLTSVTIPDSVTSIGDDAFLGCDSLTDVYYGGSEAQWNAINILNNNNLLNATIHYNSTGLEPTPGLGLSSIVALSPANGATDVPFQGSNLFSITFDRAIKSLDGHEFRPDINLTNDVPFAIYRASDNQLIYKCSSNYDFLLNSDKTKMTLEISSTTNLASSFEANTQYYVAMGEGFVDFQDGTVSPAITKGQWTFITKGFSDTVNITFKTGAGKKEVATEPVLWNDGWFEEPATTYNHDLAIAALALSGAAYVQKSSETVTAALRSLGFNVNEKDAHYEPPTSEEDCDTISYTFAQKKVYVDNNWYTLVAVVIKGTSPDYEWYSNFDVGTGKVHKGFGVAAGKLMNDLNGYIEKIEGPVKFLVTGHSRGAAVANLVAAELTKRNALPNAHSHIAYGQKDVYGYTFATPKASMDGTESGYGNIYNILNPEDLVTRVGLSQWGFNHYGVDLILPSRSFIDFDKVGDKYIMYPFLRLSEKMESNFANLTGEKFRSYGGTEPVDDVVSNIYKLAENTYAYATTPHVLTLSESLTVQKYFELLAGILADRNAEECTKKIKNSWLSSLWTDYGRISEFFIFDEHFAPHFSHAHSVAAYYSWLTIDEPVEILYSAPEGSATKVTFKRVVIACPVDVYVRDQGGNIVASVVNEEIVENTLAVYVKDGEKTIDLPNGQEYSIEIVAREEGTVSYTVEEKSFAGVGDTTLRTVTFDNIEIEEDDVLTGEVDDPFSIPAADYALTKNGEEVIYPDSDSLNQAPSVPSYPSNSGGASNSSYQISVAATSNGTVTVTPKSAESGAKVTITAVPKDGYIIGSVTVTNSRGDSVSVADNGDGTYTFIMPASAVSVNATFVVDDGTGAPAATVQFNDVPVGAFYYDAVLWAVEQGITTGTSSTTFSPNATCTRAQMVTFLWRAAGSPKAAASSPFTDVPVDSYYYDAVLWAVEQGITNGTSSSTFSPDSIVSRAQTVTFLHRFAGSPMANGGTNFTDVSAGQFYTDAVAWAVANGITTGTSSTTFSPNSECTRGQTVTFLYRLLAE